VNCRFISFSKAARFNDLVESVQHCDLCPRLSGRRKVLSSSNGSVQSRVVFVAEAPGRLGAERTGIPLSGDRSGENFESLLGNIGWRREDVFITNAALCNPQQENGNNGTPSPDEVANCSAYLEMVLSLVSPEVVVTMGTTALDALELISPHGLQLRDAVAHPTPWRGLTLFPLYHPGPRAAIHRSLPKQRSDFMLLAKFVHPVTGLIKRKGPRKAAANLAPGGASIMQHVARALVELGGRMTYFKMTKLMYLVDLFALQRLGHTVASDIYLRQVDGPWPPSLDKALSAMQGYEVRRFFVRSLPVVAPGPSPRFEAQLDDRVLEIIVDVHKKYGALSNSAIKTAVYLTDPMQFILREESKGRDMRKKPVLYKDKTAAQIDKA